VRRQLCLRWAVNYAYPGSNCYYLEELTAPPSTIHATTRGVAEMLI